MRDTEVSADAGSKDEERNMELVDRYLLGQLSAAEAEQFEVAFLGSPDLVTELEATERLMHGLKAHGASLATKIESTGTRSWFKGSRFIAAAASLVAAIAIGFSINAMQQVKSLSSPILFGEAIIAKADAPITYVGVSRGNSGQMVALPDHQTTPWILLSLDLGIAESAKYRVEFLDDAGGNLWQSDQITPNADDILMLGLSTKIMQAGDYAIKATPVNSAGAGIGAPLRFNLRLADATIPSN